VKKYRFSVVTAIFLTLAVFFSQNACAADKGQSELPRVLVSITTKTGAVVTVNAEAARSASQKQTGLMWRKHLAPGDGMIFIYERDEVMRFYMKNTLIPLSIAYIASDGRIVDILDMAPRSLRTVSSSRAVRYALEVPQGWFASAGVSVGDTMTMEN